MYELPLINVFRVWGLGVWVGARIFLSGFWAMALCHWRFVPRPNYTEILKLITIESCLSLNPEETTEDTSISSSSLNM